ncbi:MULTISPECIES: hypothetical protein [unclassified Bifidobacterium]|uniref:hypothetical protein n=1 Tax=unclassified Bifidobacterium TaxID=2608897 RepID=UPI001128EB1C|nr:MULTISPECIES: hypothetical protein [unclassified Bifidobacterium]TPF78115.1 hypothetical protein BW09_05705 [Bifidobacterium sp. UTCIF-1]TPF81074.1 hypothetical protein BW08_00095 [Bifidobacterium sp. UTCIF-24]TPF82079.1 hypothetical protein BW12_06320 [Bifidobacterium sp. UTCIF-3]TPF85298.1 hypothetical protein BW07_01090 [Bifidobacterium sp. UTCIF-36]TPF91134.1 hypothetical protein BW10_01105 [Bifidobacterium sp. UTBIF-56]
MKKFFQGLSLSSIVAGTLAAVTSFLLAAKIGVAGSVIGAAASYIVSVVATNIYKNLITASSEKFQQTLGNSGSEDADNDDAGDEGSGDPSIDQDTDGTAKAEQSKDADADASRERSGHGPAQGRTVEPQGAASARRPREIVSRPNDGHTYSIAELRKHRHDPKRTAVVVTLVSGLLTVAVTAGIVMLVTQGHGTDTVVSDLISPTTSSDSTTDDGDSTVQPHHNDQNPQYGQSDQNDGTGNENTTTDGTTNDSTNSNGTGSDSSNSGTTNGSGTTDSTGSSGSDSTGSSGTNGSGTNGSGTSGDTSGSTGSDSNSGSTSGSTSTGSGSSSSGSSNSGGSTTGSNEGVSFSPIR